MKLCLLTSLPPRPANGRFRRREAKRPRRACCRLGSAPLCGPHGLFRQGRRPLRESMRRAGKIRPGLGSHTGSVACEIRHWLCFECRCLARKTRQGAAAACRRICPQCRSIAARIQPAQCPGLRLYLAQSSPRAKRVGCTRAGRAHCGRTRKNCKMAYARSPGLLPGKRRPAARPGRKLSCFQSGLPPARSALRRRRLEVKAFYGAPSPE